MGGTLRGLGADLNFRESALVASGDALRETSLEAGERRLPSAPVLTSRPKGCLRSGS